MCDHTPQKLDRALVEDLNDLYENAPCGYLSMAADGAIVKVNKTLCEWMHAESRDLIGKRFLDILSVPGKIFFETHFGPLLRMQGFFNEVALDLAGPGGRYIPVLANALERRDDEGGLLFTRVTLFQAGARRQYERELVEARNAAVVAKRELQTIKDALERRMSETVERTLSLQQGLVAEREAAKLREQFVAILGHDLRNPLASISGGLNLLKKEPQSTKSMYMLSLMDKSTKRMFNLIDDMLDFTRLRSGAGIAVKLEQCDLKAVIDQVIEELRTAHPARTILSRLSIPPKCRCDCARIAQVVSNLIGNALSHGAKDGPVRVEAATRGTALEISVINNGKPIPRYVQDRLFQPFFRVDAGSEGLGLGLFIASEIVRGHGGELKVSSIPDETRFSFSLPQGLKEPGRALGT